MISIQRWRLSFYFPWCPGRCIVISFNEANTFWAGYRETLTFWCALWFYPEILHWNSWRLCHTSRSTGEHNKYKSPRTGFLAQRFWSCTFLLKASVPKQNSSRDITNSTKAGLNPIAPKPGVENIWYCVTCI